MHIIRAREITKVYTGRVVLDQVTLDVPAGSIYGLLGPNGAGKTTFLRILNRILIADSGELFFQNRNIESADTRSMGYLPEERGLYKKMKIGEQCLYLAGLKGMRYTEASKKLRYWFDKMGMPDWWNKRVEELSKGMQQKVQFISTVLHEPELLVLDEPFSGFDPVNAALIKNELLEYRKNGKTIILSTHDMNSVEELCDEISLIDRGRVILQGEVRRIKESFSHNRIEITCKNTGMPENLPYVEGCKVISMQSGSDYFTVLLSVPQTRNTNLLLRTWLDHFEVIDFKVLLPSMNEIFIEAVNRSEA